MTEAFDEWRDSRSAYEFFENERMSLSVLLTPPIRAVAQTLRELPEESIVLNVQDTTEINLSHLTTMQGLGEIGNPCNQGLFLHPCLAVSTEGVPIGLLAAQTWVRPANEHGKAKASKTRSFTNKESLRWWTGVERAEEQVQHPGLLVHVSDRESDIYELFRRSIDAGYRLLVRACQDRRVEGDYETLWQQVSSFPSKKQHRVISVPSRPAKEGKPARAAREASVTIRFGAIVLCAPHRAEGTVEMTAIEVFEPEPPEGEDPIEWLLLTTDPIRSFAEAWTRVEWYRFRWRIEEFFKVLKSGCKIEERQFESRATFEVSLGISILVAVKLLCLVKHSRVEPDAPATDVLTEEEEHVLRHNTEKLRGRDPSSPLTLHEAVIQIAMLGGYKARSCDGPPGWITLWRGYKRLCTLIDGYRLAKPQRPSVRGKSRGT